MGNFFSELKRRNVVKVGVAYAVVGWILVEVSSVVLPGFGAPDWVFKVTMYLVFLGFPLAVIFAWAFELTPEGLKLEKDIDRDQSITKRTGRKLDFAIIGLLVVALGVSLKLHFTGEAMTDAVSPDSASTDKSIAVLPFVNMSDDPANEYFSDGIAEELLNVLVRVKGLEVASRTSSFRFKESELSIPEIADELNVDHVLEGSVRKAGNQVRITAQLIDVKTDRHLWSDSYDRELEDVFAIQEEISNSIVAALKVALGAEDQGAIAEAAKPTDNLEAYQLYLQGRYNWQRRGTGPLRKSIEQLERAVELDPNFARAWSTLGLAYVTIIGYTEETKDTMGPPAEAAARKALSLDPTLAEPRAVLANISHDRFDWAEAEAQYHEAIQADPNNSIGYLWMSVLLVEAGRMNDALPYLGKALELDPASGVINGWLASAHMNLGQLDEALRYADAAVDLGWGFGNVVRGRVLYERGDYEAARESFRQGPIRRNPELVAALDPVFEAYGDETKLPAALAAIEQVVIIDPNFGPYFFYLDFVLANRFYESSQQAVDKYDHYIFRDIWPPRLQVIREDERFVKLVIDFGLLDYWRSHGWPDKCEPSGESFTCQ